MSIQAPSRARVGRVPIRTRREAASAGQDVVDRQDWHWLLVGLAFASIIAIGMALANGILTFLGVIGAFGISLLAPPAGLVILAVMAPLQPPQVIPPPGFHAVLIFAILIGCLGRLPIDRPRLSASASILLALAFFGYTMVQQIPEMLAGWVGEQGYLTYSWFLQMAMGLGAILATLLTVKGRSPYPYLVALLVGASVAAALAVGPYLNVASPFVANLVVTVDETRVSGPFGNPNYFGQYLATAAVLAVVLWSCHGSRAQRAVLVGVTALLMLALALTFSRGGIVAFVVGLVGVAFARSRQWGMAALGVAALAAFLIYPIFLDWRLDQVAGSSSEASHSAQADDDAGGRLGAALAGPVIFASSPVVGVGLGHFPASSVRIAGTSTQIESHNWYMNVLAEQGAIGVILWAGLLAAVAWELRNRSTLSRSLGYGMMAAVAGGCLFLQLPTSYQAAALPAVALAIALAARWGDAQDRAPTRPRERRRSKSSITSLQLR